MSAREIIVLCCFVLNILLVFVMIFIERRKPESIISWLVVLTFFPITGFLLYVVIGSGLSLKTRLMLKRRRIFNSEYSNFVEFQKRGLYKNKGEILSEKIEEMIKFNLNNSSSACYQDNKVDVYLSGPTLLEKMKSDIENAKHSINIEYYIFARDKTGRSIMDLLVKKAKDGVKVNLIYDSVGCIRYPRWFYNRVKSAGGKVAEFFPPFLGIRLLNFKMNYRNHRKIVVIDGKIGYCGGVNLRDDHMGKSKKLSPWRDTHFRIEGEGVYGLQSAFFNDYCATKKIKADIAKLTQDGYFPSYNKKGQVACQIVTSGPDFELQRIKEAYVKMISLARKRVCIQTPYFVPDDVFISAIKQAISSGVVVEIMIPKKPDKRIVYSASLSYVRDMIKLGAKVYLYDGFLHSKTMLVDSEFCSIGTTNMDNRSFALNFEINAFFYDSSFCQLNQKYFDNDKLNSSKISLDFFKKKRLYTNLLQAIYRLFSPLL